MVSGKGKNGNYERSCEIMGVFSNDMLKKVSALQQNSHIEDAKRQHESQLAQEEFRRAEVEGKAFLKKCLIEFPQAAKAIGYPKVSFRKFNSIDDYQNYKKLVNKLDNKLVSTRRKELDIYHTKSNKVEIINNEKEQKWILEHTQLSSGWFLPLAFSTTGPGSDGLPGATRSISIEEILLYDKQEKFIYGLSHSIRNGFLSDKSGDHYSNTGFLMDENNSIYCGNTHGTMYDLLPGPIVFGDLWKRIASEQYQYQGVVKIELEDACNRIWCCSESNVKMMFARMFGLDKWEF